MSSASTLPPASQTSNTTSASTNLNNPANNAAARSNMRSTGQVKGADGPRRQSPIDFASRRPPAPKAWTSGTNPLIQKGPPTPHSNGVATPSKASKMTTAAKETSISHKHAHDRSIAAFGAAMGSPTTILTKLGDKYQGLMAGASLVQSNPKITLKMTKKLQQADNNNNNTTTTTTTTTNGILTREAALVGASPEHAMTFDMRDLVEIDFADLSLVESTKMANGSSSKFRTDVDISGNVIRGERTLKKWVPDGPDSTDYSLDGRGAGDWDQFATAKQMTGLESTYHENEYTTVLDKSSLTYKMREAEAARMEKEILGTTSANVHLREERGQQAENDPDDEEAKYSGVRRDDSSFSPLPTGGPNTYVAPARRAPTALPTVAGAPVDPAIVSTTKPVAPIIKVDREDAPTGADSTDSTPEIPSSGEGKRSPDPSEASNRDASAGGQTEGVAGRLLHDFRDFKETEKQKLVERKRQQASHDRTAKLNELLRFSKTFKLKTPIPTDLVGILAKDPVKQDAIIEKAKRETEESTSATSSPSAPASEAASRKTELPQMATIPERPQAQTFNKGRGGYPTVSGRGLGQSGMFAGRGTTNSLRGTGSKPGQPHQIPPPIPILDGRLPPTGPMADQNPLNSPQRSNLQTPTSATSSARFNLSVKAAEFRPNAAAPSFNPSASSNAPSSPASVQRTTSVSRAASPSAFFGARKPKPLSERPSIADNFNPIKRMKSEVAAKVAAGETPKSDGGPPHPQKDFAQNGGIPNAYQTGPRWTVRPENEEKTYKMPFERAAPPTVQPVRSGSVQHMSYPNHMNHMPTGPANVPQTSTPQHMHAGNSHHYPGQYDDGHARPMIPMGPAYSSPSITSRQPSAYASPMVQGAQLAYGGQQYYGGNPQMPMQMRYPVTPMHQNSQMAAPMMVPQQSNGPYMQMQQQYGGQMPMYSPNPAHVYPQQQNGYHGSPGRAPMMMQQNSQQSYHPGQPMMHTMSQGGPIGYPQQGQGMMPRGYGNQYGSSPQQPYGMQQRTMSSGYGQKMMQQQHMQPGSGPPMNAPQQPAAYNQDEGK